MLGFETQFTQDNLYRKNFEKININIITRIKQVTQNNFGNIILRGQNFSKQMNKNVFEKRNCNHCNSVTWVSILLRFHI